MTELVISKSWGMIVTYFVGLDVSLEETAICVIDDAGRILREGKAASDPEAIATWLKSINGEINRLGLEAGPLSPWLCSELQAAGLPAVCIETRRMKGATAAMAVKTDRNDARAIAQAMRVGWFTAVHVKTTESQELRLLLTNRKMLLTSRIALENEIRGTLKAFGLKVGRVTAMTFEARVIELTADRSRLQAMVRPMLAARQALQLQYQALPRIGTAGGKSGSGVQSIAHCARGRRGDRAGLCNSYRRSGALCSVPRCGPASRTDPAQVRLRGDRPQRCDQ
jgi:transposase